MVLVAALLVALATPVGAEDPLCDATPGCAASFVTNEPCGVNLTTDGRTCVHHARLGFAPGGPGQPEVVVEEEDANGHVGVHNTPNVWTSHRVAARASAGGLSAGVDAEALVSEQHPGGPGTSQQVRVAASPDVNGETTRAGVAVRLYDGAPRWCLLMIPVGDTTLDCSLDPVETLLP